MIVIGAVNIIGIQNDLVPTILLYMDEKENNNLKLGGIHKSKELPFNRLRFVIPMEPSSSPSIGLLLLQCSVATWQARTSS